MSSKLALRILAAFTIILLGAYLTLDHIAPAGRRLIKIRGEDPVAYFGTAHSMLFDHDFNLTDEFARIPPDVKWWTANQPETGLPGSPWGLGYSFLEMPLLAFGTGIDAVTGHPADGYSRWAVFFYCIGTVLMAGLGLIALFPLLREVGHHFNMPDNSGTAWALFITLVIFFGTNVGFYAFSQMAESATFLCISLFMWAWWRFRDSEGARSWLLLGVIGGFLSICRWQDVLFLGAPLMYDLFGGDLLKKRFSWLRSRAAYACGIAVCWIPQLMQWKAIYGKYLTVPHGGGIFSFPPQHMLQVLLSTQSGWFTWTPVVALGTAGLLIGTFRSPRIYLPWLIILILQVALVGSIWFWDGLGSFGSRYLLSNIPIVAIGLMAMFSVSTSRLRQGLAASCAVCCVFTSLFAIQFRLDLVPTSTPLTFSELVTDKLRLVKVWQRKEAKTRAQELIAKGDAASAARLLEATSSLGEDRDVDKVLERAYLATGKTEQAEAVALRRRDFLHSRLY